MFSRVQKSKLKHLWLLKKWNCGGTSGQAQYKQLLENEGESDASIFIFGPPVIRMK